MSDPLKPIKWANDDKLVHFLKDGQVEFAVEEIRLNDINLEESKKRQSRFDRVLDQDRVLSIAISMEEGVPVPRMCVRKIKGAGYVILAGLHRAHGAKTYVADRDNSYKIACYVVKSGDETFIEDVLPSLTNAVEGLGLTMEQRRLRAAELVLNNDAPIEEVAKQYGLMASTLEKYIAHTKIKDRLIGLGVEVKGSLNKGVIMESLRGVSYSDNLLKAAGTLFSQHDVKLEDAKEVIRKIKKAGTEGGGLIAIGEASRNLKGKEQPERAAWSQSPRRSQFLKNSGQLLSTLSKYSTFDALQVTVPEDRTFVEARVRELIDKLSELLDNEPQRKRA